MNSIEKIMQSMKAIKIQFGSLSKVVNALTLNSFSFTSTLSRLRTELNESKASVKGILEGFGIKGGTGLIVETAKAAGKLTKHYYEKGMSEYSDRGDLARGNADEIRDTAAAYNESSKLAEKYLNALKALSAQEKLSGTDMQEAVKLLNSLEQTYANLGVRLDESTGKITGLDSAMIKKLQRDKRNNLAWLNAEIRELKKDNEEQASLREKSIWFDSDRQLQAAKQFQSNNQRIMELEKQKRNLANSDPVADYYAQLRIEKQGKLHTDQSDRQSGASLYDRAMDAMENRNTGYETAAFRDGHGIERAALTAEEAGTILHLNQHSGGFGGVTPDGENLRKMISDNVRSSAKLLENIRNLCEQLNKKVEESART